MFFLNATYEQWILNIPITEFQLSKLPVVCIHTIQVPVLLHSKVRSLMHSCTLVCKCSTV